MWIHASEQSPPPTCASVYVHVMKRSTREWLSSFPETNGRRGEKNLSHRIVAILSFFRSCGCTMRYSLICRLYALCNSQSYSKHVVKVTWLTWLKSTKRNVFFFDNHLADFKDDVDKGHSHSAKCYWIPNAFSKRLYLRTQFRLHTWSFAHSYAVHTGADEREEEKTHQLS